MIPNQQGAMNNASKLLKKGGHVAIADFFLKGNYDDCLPPLSKKFRSVESVFHKNWFALGKIILTIFFLYILDYLIPFSHGSCVYIRCVCATI